MEITHVKIFPVQEDKLKAFVSVVFDNCFMVNDIKIIQGKDGLFLSMPSRRKKTGEFKDVAHPLNSATRLMLEEHVLKEYRLEVDDATPRRPDHEEDDAPGVSSEARGSGSAEGPRVEDASDHSQHANNGSSSASPSAEQRGAGEEVEDAASRPDSENRQADKNGSSGSAAGSGSDSAGRADSDQHEPSLEEVQEKILQDSFWSRPIDRSS